MTWRRLAAALEKEAAAVASDAAEVGILGTGVDGAGARGAAGTAVPSNRPSGLSEKIFDGDMMARSLQQRFDTTKMPLGKLNSTPRKASDFARSKSSSTALSNRCRDRRRSRAGGGLQLQALSSAFYMAIPHLVLVSEELPVLDSPGALQENDLLQTLEQIVVASDLMRGRAAVRNSPPTTTAASPPPPAAPRR